ncbi:MAG: helix-turn-helix transcriptional regulator [Treponema sp.]|nr:helix-turn-helix transcriptional regulator [Treponema sp.]
MPTQQIFINNLKSFRKKAGYTQAQLAILIDKSFNYINGIECGVSFPPPNVIDKISEVLKIKPAQLFDENGCEQNIIDLDKNQFIKELSDQVFKKIEPKIKKDIIEGIKESLG